MASPKKTRTKQFEFDKKCIYCFDDASDEFIEEEKQKPVDLRRHVSKISKETSLQNILDKCNTQKNQKNMKIKQLVSELKSEDKEGRYHRDCQKDFLNPKSKSSQSSTSWQVLEYYTAFIGNNPSQNLFAFTDLLDAYQRDNPDENIPQKKFLKTYLQGNIDKIENDNLFVVCLMFLFVVCTFLIT